MSTGNGYVIYAHWFHAFPNQSAEMVCRARLTDFMIMYSVVMHACSNRCCYLWDKYIKMEYIIMVYVTRWRWKVQMWVLVIAISSVLIHALPNKNLLKWYTGLILWLWTLVLDSLTCGFANSASPSEKHTSWHIWTFYIHIVRVWAIYTWMYGAVHRITCAVSEWTWQHTLELAPYLSIDSSLGSCTYLFVLLSLGVYY